MESSDPNADSRDERPAMGISLQTLIVASLASAAASFAASRIWGPGTLISAAATPVIVALVSEFLRRPVQTVAATARKVPAVTSVPAARRRSSLPPDDPVRVDGKTAIPDQPDARVFAWRPHWRSALVTGLVAFAIVVALYTVPDLVAGRSITGNGQPTTFFGGSANVKKKTGPATTVTTAVPTTTVTKSAPTTTTTTGATSRTGTTSTTSTASSTTTSTSTTTPTTSTTPSAVNPTTTQTTPAP